jgi:hypothetical protein
MVQVAIGITVGLFFSSFMVYSIGTSKKGRFLLEGYPSQAKTMARHRHLCLLICLLLPGESAGRPPFICTYRCPIRLRAFVQNAHAMSSNATTVLP